VSGDVGVARRGIYAYNNNKQKESYLYWLQRICLRKHAIKGKTAVKGNRGRRYKQLVDDLEEKR
jgi:hypothetical protein